jgi:hypothetical protein
METINVCPICHTDSFDVINETEYLYHCSSCGNFQLDCKADEIRNQPGINSSKLCDFAGYLFETNRKSETFRYIKLNKEANAHGFENEVYSSGLVPKTTLQKIDKFVKIFI